MSKFNMTSKYRQKYIYCHFLQAGHFIYFSTFHNIIMQIFNKFKVIFYRYNLAHIIKHLRQILYFKVALG